MRKKISRKSVSEESNLVFQKAASPIAQELNIPNTRLSLASAYQDLFAHLLVTSSGHLAKAKHPWLLLTLLMEVIYNALIFYKDYWQQKGTIYIREDA